MENKRFNLGKYVIDIKWEYEDSQEVTEHYGDGQSSVEEWVVDRKRGLLLGEWKEVWITIPAEGLGLSYFNEEDFHYPYYGEYGDDLRLYPTSNAFAKATAVFEPLVKATGIDCWGDDEDNGWDIEYDADDNTFYVCLEGYQIISDEPSNMRYERNSYRYFKPNMDDATEGGEVQPKYILRNYKYWDTFGTDWWEMYPKVTITLFEENGYENELATGFGYSVSSDTNVSEIRSVEIQALDEALDEAGLTKVKAAIVLKNYEAGRYEEVVS